MIGGDPPPGASFNEPPSLMSGAFWALHRGRPAGSLDSRRGGPDLFARLRAERRVTAQLVVTLVALAIGLALLAVVPVVGLATLLVTTWSAVVDLILLGRLRRSIADAWVDLALGHD